MVASENIRSDYDVWWGAYSRDWIAEFGIEGEKLLVGGYPRKAFEVGEARGFKKGKKVLILLARKNFEEDNLKVLNFASKFTEGVSFDVKGHPTLDLVKLEQIPEFESFNFLPTDMKLSELFTGIQYDLSIAINTAAYYESYVYDIPSIRLNSSNFENSIPVNDSDDFETFDEFAMQLRISLIDTVYDENYWRSTQKRLGYILGYGEDNYKRIIEEGQYG